MKNLKFFILILVSTFSLSAMAQTIGDYIDVVHLKNGSLIKGVIIEQIPGKTVRIKTQDGSEYVYPENEVVKYTREEKPELSKKSKDNNLRYGNNFKRKGKGYFFEAEIMYGALSNGFRITNGYRFHRLAKLGAAIGLESLMVEQYYNYSGYYDSSFDVYTYYSATATFNVVFSGDILNKRITPFYQAELGYGLDINNVFSALNNTHNSTGPMAGLMFGVKFKTKKRIEYKLGLDVKLLKSNAFYEDEMKPSAGLRFGIGF